MCSSRKYPYLTSKGTFALDPPPPTPPYPPYPPPPVISVILQLCWVLSGNNIGGKNVVDNFFGNFMRKNLFVHVCTASNNLKDILS